VAVAVHKPIRPHPYPGLVCLCCRTIANDNGKYRESTKSKPTGDSLKWASEYQENPLRVAWESAVIPDTWEAAMLPATKDEVDCLVRLVKVVKKKPMSSGSGGLARASLSTK
jgi:hypothetical protein